MKQILPKIKNPSRINNVAIQLKKYPKLLFQINKMKINLRFENTNPGANIQEFQNLQMIFCSSTKVPFSLNNTHSYTRTQTDTFTCYTYRYNTQIDAMRHVHECLFICIVYRLQGLLFMNFHSFALIVLCCSISSTLFSSDLKSF